MLSDIRTVMWKEWREVLRMGGRRRRAVVRMVLSVGVLGVIWPWQIGAQFVTSQLVTVLAAFTAVMYVAGVVPDSFAGERERHTLETLLASRLPDRAILLGKVAALLAYGLAAAAIMLLFGWATVNVVHRTDRLLFYDPLNLAAAAIFSVIAAGLMAAIGVLVSLRSPTVKQAQQVLSTLVLVLLFAPVIAIPTMPPAWRAAIIQAFERFGVTGAATAIVAGLLLLEVVLYRIAVARFKRARLILEQ